MRLNRDEDFLGLAREVGQLAGCDRGRSGCVAVRGDAVILRGYARPSAGTPSCDDAGHLLTEMVLDGEPHLHCVRLVHAEQVVISEAARLGLCLDGTTFYCTMEPCRACAMSVVAAGASRVVAHRRYHAGASSRRLLADAGVELVVWLNEVATYPDQSPAGADTSA